MAWLILLLGGVFECVWAIGIKYTEGFTKPVPSAITLIAMVLSVWLLSAAMKTIPAGTAYAVWTGIGILGVAAVGIFFMGEAKDLPRLFCLLLIISGIAGLKLLSPH